MANIHAALNSRNVYRIVNAGYHRNQASEEVLKELHDRGYQNVTLEMINQQWEEFDNAGTDEPRW